MKKLIGCVLTIMLVFVLFSFGNASITASAESYTDGCYTYTVWYDEAFITDCYTSISGDITIPSTLGGYTVTTIDSVAFLNCKNLTSVTIPDSVKSIGSNAFENCTSITNVTIGSGITSIGQCIFYGCKNLTSITIPDSVRNIGFGAFYDCTSLENVYYCGTEEQWNAIVIDPSANLPTSATIHYNSLLEYGFKCSIIDGEVTITDYVGSGGDITIPSTLWNYPVTSIGYDAFYNCDNLTSITIPDSVTSIGRSAFSNCSNLTSITLPFVGGSSTDNKYLGYIFGASSYSDNEDYVPSSLKTVILSNACTSIGDDAFRKCSYITSVKIGGGVTSIGEDAFYYCDSLESVTIGNGVTSIGRYAFSNCSSITSITIPDSVTSIGWSAFSNCSSLTSITVPFVGNSATDNGLFGYIFRGGCGYNDVPSSLKNVILSNACTSIGRSAFSNCSSLTSITIPDSVTSIGYDAFRDCDSLKDVHITDIKAWCNIDFGSSSSSTIQSSNPLYYAENLYLNGELITNLAIPDGVINIPDYAFYNQDNIVSVTIPDSVTSIGNYAFYSCNSLKDVYITDIKAWCNIDFIDSYSNPLYNAENLYLNGELITDLVIPDGVTNIPVCAFYNQDSIVSVTIPDGVTSIGHDAFYNCRSLTSITIPDNVTSIGVSAFESCSSLTSIVIPDSVTSIDRWAFRWCSKLTSIIIPDSVTSIGYGAFSICASLTSITVDSENQYYCSDDGVLYNKNKTEFICYPAGKTANTFYIPASVTSINKYAFSGSDLISVVIPDSVTSIEGLAFFLFGRLKSVTIPVSVTSIGSQAFDYCYRLETVYYRGSKTERNNITIHVNNSDLINATWYYNSCIGSATHSYDNNCDVDCNVCNDVRTPSDHIYTNNCDAICDECNQTTRVPSEHIYDHACDTECNECGNIRTIEHSYTLNVGHTCGVCGYSRTPDAPTLKYKDSAVIILNATEGMEYSLDGVNWQDENYFVGFEGDKTYIFYQRVKAAENALQSDTSIALAVSVKNLQKAPENCRVTSFTDTAVQLLYVAGCEYSIDGENWGSDFVFKNLLPATKYTFYQRFAETETAEASDCATVTIKTDKSTMSAPDTAPSMASHTANSITLNEVFGLEYSINGINWQKSPVFVGLSCGTEYTFYQRYAETDTNYASKPSASAVIKTDKGIPNAPEAPTLLKKTHSSVTLVAVDGYEYSLDGVNWQKSSVFLNLNPETNYFFYCRYAENERYYASPSSEFLKVRTNETPLCAITGEHSYDDICDEYCNYCEEERPNAHVYENNCDDTCNECGTTRTVGDHIYSSVCDPACNECGKEREGSPHTYKNDCDKDCDVCGEIRQVSDHVFTNGCDAVCNVCGAIRTVPAHIYLNGCDADCNECGMIRIVGDHIYTNACDTECNECGDKREVPEHVYSSDCDVTCNNCGHIDVRDVIEHKYSNDCDTVCNACGFTRTVLPHKYTNDCDATCNECGELREVTAHRYTNNCDANCDECGALRIPYAHIYENNCDTTCNECGETRPQQPHIYTDSHDATCNECGATRTPTLLGHKYDSGNDTECNICGFVRTGEWYSDGQSWYYRYSDGTHLASTWGYINGDWYYFNQNGVMLTNWQQIDGSWYYFNSNGTMAAEQWVKDSKGWCYLGSSGRMVTNSWIKDSVGWCYVGADGYCVTNCWMQDSIGWCYLDSNGRMAINRWIKDSVGWCYVGADGYCVANSWMQDSIGWCYLDANGRMVTNTWIKDSNGYCWLDENGYWNGVYA